MAKKKPKEPGQVKVVRPKRAKLTAKESLKRMQTFDQRREQFIAAVREQR